MGNFFHYLKTELKALFRPVMLIPLLSGVMIVAAAGMIINLVIVYPPPVNIIAVLDNDNSANSSAVSSWLDTSRLQVQRFFNKRAMYIRNDLNDLDINVAIEMPDGFSKALNGSGQAFINTYAFMNDLTVKSAMREDVITYAYDAVNKWARDNKLNLTGVEMPISRFDYFISGQHIAGVKNTQIFKDFSSRSINLQISVLILIVFAFLFMVFKSLPAECRVQLDPADTTHHRFRLISAKMISAVIPAFVLSAIYLIFCNRYFYGYLTDLVSGKTVKALGLGFGSAGITLLGLSLVISIITAMSLPLILANIKRGTVRTALAVIFALGLFLGPFLIITILDSKNFFVNILPFSNSFTIPVNVYLKRYMEIVSGFTWQLILFVTVLVMARIITVRIYRNPATPEITHSGEPTNEN